MLEIEIKEVIILICESTERDTNRLIIGNSGSEQETFCFLSGKGRLPFKRKYLMWDKSVGSIEEIVSGRASKGPEVGETYHPTLSRSQLKRSSALSTFTLFALLHCRHRESFPNCCYFMEGKILLNTTCKFGSCLFLKTHLVLFCFLS